MSAGSRVAARDADAFFSSTSDPASRSSRAARRAISPSSTAPILPAKVVQTGVPSATASRFIVPPAETTRSAERDEALRVDRVLGDDERRQGGAEQRVALSRRARQHDRLHGVVAAEPLEHFGKERVAVAVVERDLGRRAHDGEDARAIEAEPVEHPASGEKPAR